MNDGFAIGHNRYMADPSAIQRGEAMQWTGLEDQVPCPHRANLQRLANHILLHRRNGNLDADLFVDPLGKAAAVDYLWSFFGLRPEAVFADTNSRAGNLDDQLG